MLIALSPHLAAQQTVSTTFQAGRVVQVKSALLFQFNDTAITNLAAFPLLVYADGFQLSYNKYLASLAGTQLNTLDGSISIIDSVPFTTPLGLHPAHCTQLP